MKQMSREYTKSRSKSRSYKDKEIGSMRGLDNIGWIKHQEDFIYISNQKKKCRLLPNKLYKHIYYSELKKINYNTLMCSVCPLSVNDYLIHLFISLSSLYNSKNV
jgi:hypothetical protein